MELLEPWHVPQRADLLERQLATELPRGHALFGVPVRAVAQRQDCDDVLFELLDGSGRVAVVHLTYSMNFDPAWPFTTVFNGLPAWTESRMLKDHLDFNT